MIIKTKDDLFKFLVKYHLDENHRLILQKIDGGHDTNIKLTKETKLSSPLVSYYLNGTQKTNGLFQLGLIQRKHNEFGKSIGIELTELGTEVLKLIK